MLFIEVIFISIRTAASSYVLFFAVSGKFTFFSFLKVLCQDLER